MTKIGLQNELAGAFKISVSGGERGELCLTKELGYEDGWMPNLILDSGIDLFMQSVSMSSGNAYGYIQLGTSSEPVIPTQTGLVAWGVGGGHGDRYGRNSGLTHGWSEEGGYGWTRKTHRFGKGVAQGTWAEIGAAPSSRGNCFSRALIQDSSGNPTTITVLENEFLTVVYEVRRWWVVPEPYTVEFDDDGQLVEVLVTHQEPYASAVRNSAPTNAYCGNGLSHKYGESVELTHLPYTGGNKRTLRLFYSINQGNNGIEGLATPTTEAYGFLVGGAPVNMQWILKFTPTIQKTNEFEMYIDLEYSISRKEEP